MAIAVRLVERDEADALAPDLLRLLTELSASSASLSPDVLAERLRDGVVRVVVAESGDEIVGMASLCLFTTLANGTVGHVEDVVVSALARGQGVGAALMHLLAEEGARCGCRHLDLTSRPSREAANRLYVSLGYERRETNVYRLRVPSSR